MGNKLKKYYQTIPKIYNVETNPIINAVVQALASNDEEICTQLDNVKLNMFIKTASGVYLDILANSLGVERPTSIGLLDDQYRELVPNLSFKAKQIRKTFYDTMDVFWGPLFSRANVKSNNAGPFNISIGDKLSLIIDGKVEKDLKILSTDLVTEGAMTSTEVVTWINRYNICTAIIEEDYVTGNEYINIRTNSPGIKGSIEIVSSSILGGGKLDFTIGKYSLLQQNLRTVIYNINPNEIIIEIPAIVPALRRTLKGSHHFHEDSTIEPPVAPANGIWQGSFIFDSRGVSSDFTISNKNAKIQEQLVKGSVYTKVTVDDVSAWGVETGEIIFGFGTDHEEQPIKFRGIPNSNTVLLDPSHVFQYTQPIDTYINILSSTQKYVPRKNGDDLGIYLVSPSDARALVQTILETLRTAGVIITFIIIAPEYRYLIENPYLTS